MLLSPLKVDNGSTNNVPQMKTELSDGIASMPRRFTRRERLADAVYLHLQFTSRLAPLVGAGVGYSYAGFWGALMGVVAGGLFGLWMRHSMGGRTRDPRTYYARMAERAHGSRRRALEWVIEEIRGNVFTREKCRALAEAYRDFHRRASVATSREELRVLVDEIDRKTKEISYG